jgi:putative glutamine amidotransferase
VPHKPVVGVTGYQISPPAARRAGFGARELSAFACTYFIWLNDVETVPVPLTPMTDIEDSLDLVDGIVLSGGADIDPAHYGAERHPSVIDTHPERDEFELALAKAALERGTPILGICRGLQLLNVAHGGTLHQHVPDLPGALVHSSEWETGVRDRSRKWGPVFHPVEVSDSRLENLFGRNLETNTYHHQAADQIGTGLSVAARSADGVVEALISSEVPVLGVQWHPEMHQSGEPGGEAPFRWLADRLAA